MIKLLFKYFLLFIFLSGTALPQKRVNVWGGDIIYRNNEYTIAIVGLELTWNRYKMISPYLNISLLLNDKKNDYKPAYSLMGVYSLIPLMIGGFAHPEDIGSAASKIISMITLLPLLATNSQHHSLITAVDSTFDNSTELSIFIQNRSDYYEEKWLRINPGFGFSISFYSQRDSTKKNNHLLSFSAGIEKPIDFYKFNSESMKARYFLEIHKFF